MANGFRDLVVWQKSRQLVAEVYAITREFPKEERYGLTSQLRRAAISVPSNIAEGWGRGSRQELHFRATIARGSLHEVDTLFEIALDLGYVTVAQLAPAQHLILDVGRLLTGLRRSLRMATS